jgi:hypothetical protein
MRVQSTNTDIFHGESSWRSSFILTIDANLFLFCYLSTPQTAFSKKLNWWPLQQVVNAFLHFWYIYSQFICTRLSTHDHVVNIKLNGG